MSRGSPQLRDMVLARSESLRQLLSRNQGHDFEQIVLLGAGLDTKPLEIKHPGATWFACDLPEMLKERTRRLVEVGAAQESVVDVPLDFRLPNWPQKLLQAGYDPKRASLLILEGVSMYLEPSELTSTGLRIRGLVENPSSQLWLDHVTPGLLSSKLPEVRKFLASMERLGEPFRSAFTKPTEIFGAGWSTTEESLAADFIVTDDPLFREYRFATLGPVNLEGNS